MSGAPLSQLLHSLERVADLAEILTFEFVAKFDADGRRGAPENLILDRNEQNSLPDVPDLIFTGATMNEWCDDDLSAEQARLVLSIIGPHLDSIFHGLELPNKIIEQGGDSDRRNTCIECGGHLVAVLKKDTSTSGVLHGGSWEMSHMIDWDGGFRGFIASVFTLEQVRNRNSASGSEFRVLVEEG